MKIFLMNDIDVDADDRFKLIFTCKSTTYLIFINIFFIYS